MAADPDAVAKAFTDHYYNTFDTNRGALGPLYQEQSLLNFQGTKTSGSAAIQQKLSALPFKQCKHQVTSIDAQQSMSQGINIVVTGQILTEGEAQPLKFSQFFHLAPAGGSFVISNDIFQLILGP